MAKKPNPWHSTVNQNRTDRPGEEVSITELPPKEPDWYCNAVVKQQRSSRRSSASSVRNRRQVATTYRYCDSRAGAGTTHVGIGRCRVHGGDILPDPINRYQHLDNEDFVQRLQEHLGRPDPTNLLSELAFARALLEDWMNFADEAQTALMAWHASFDKKRRGLHDKPLYHVYAIQRATLLARAAGVDFAELDEGEMNEYLDEAAEIYKEEFYQAGIKHNERTGELTYTRSKDLKIEKPMKLPSIAVEAARLIQTIAQVVKTITENEKEHYISDQDFMGLMMKLMTAVMHVAQKHAMRPEGVIKDEQLSGFLSEILVEFERHSQEFSVPRSVRATALNAEVVAAGIQPRASGELRGEAD